MEVETLKRNYECMLLLDNREVKQGWDQLKETVNAMFTKFGAEVLSSRRWAERRLAFPIKGQQRGTYLLVYFNGETASNTQIRRDLELSEVVLRYQISACEQIPEEAYEPEAEFDPAAIPEGDDAGTEEAAAPEEEKKDEGKKDEEKKEAEPAAEAEAGASEGEASGEATEEKAEAGDSTESPAGEQEEVKS